MSAALALLASCQRQDIETGDMSGLMPAGEGLVSASLTASFVQTKVTYSETTSMNLKPSWTEGDIVIGFDQDKRNYSFTVSSVDADGNATLEGSTPLNCTLHLIYLCGATTAEITSGSLPVDYTGQAGDRTMPAVMIADGEVRIGTGNFQFTNAGAVIGIDAVKGVPAGSTINRITVSGENLSSAAVSLDEVSGKLKLAATVLTDDSISTAEGFTATVSDDGKGTLESKPVFIAVPAGAKVREVSVVAGGTAYAYTLPSPVTVAKCQYTYVSGQPFKIKTADALPGLFSISEDKQVRFSRGLLVATVDASGTPMAWKFAENQYDRLLEGGANKTIGKTAGDVDLFGWSTDAENNNWGIHTKTATTEGYTDGNFKDWGIAYCTYKGIAKTDTWRTLTATNGSKEWDYLLFSRPNSTNLRKCNVKVCGVEKCLILAPDNWDITSNPLKAEYSTTTSPTWEEAQAAGLVCLPMSGWRVGFNITDTSYGQYWASNFNTTDHGCRMFFDWGQPYTNTVHRHYGCLVRLVTDAKE